MRKSLSLFLIAALLLISNVSYVYADTKEKTDTSVSESSNLLEENADIEIVSEDTAIENASDTIEDEPAAEESPDAEEDEAVLEISDISEDEIVIETVTTEDGKKTAKCKITVKNPVNVKSVKLNKKTVSIKKGKTVKLKATLNPTNATNKKVTWKSSNKKVATVTSSGVVKGVKKGTATITVTTADGKKKASCKVTVKSDSATSGTGYGVYLGVDDFKTLTKLAANDDIIVIEGQSFTKAQIKTLKSGGRKVYSYLDVGSLETYRPYYKKFKNIALDQYENWPDEYWIDVSDKSWQKYISETIAENLVKKGVDGFFVDNCDVYYVYKESNAMYNGLVTIMKKLHGYGVDVIINGGDVFVTRLMKDKKTDIITGVNQECVFSRITDYEKDGFKSQTKTETKYFTDYLGKVKKKGLSVYLLEYTKDEKVKKKIKSYCDTNGFRYYISGKVNLSGE